MAAPTFSLNECAAAYRTQTMIPIRLNVRGTASYNVHAPRLSLEVAIPLAGWSLFMSCMLPTIEVEYCCLAVRSPIAGDNLCDTDAYTIREKSTAV